MLPGERQRSGATPEHKLCRTHLVSHLHHSEGTPRAEQAGSSHFDDSGYVYVVDRHIWRSFLKRFFVVFSLYFRCLVTDELGSLRPLRRRCRPVAK